MAIVGNVFGLNNVYEKQSQNTYEGNLNNWPEIAEYGYFLGGENTSSPPSHSTITRLDFLNDTFVELSKIGTIERHHVVACQTPLFGYYSGGTEPGATPTFSCNIERLDFSTDVVVDIGKDYNEATLKSSISQNNSYAFNAGGVVNGAPSINTVYRFEFSSETVSSPGNNLPATIGYMAGTQSDDNGYYAGGSTDLNGGPTTYSSNIEIFDFSTETLSDLGNDFPTTIGQMAVVESPERGYGYFSGGENNPPTPPLSLSSVHRLDFSNGTLSTSNSPIVHYDQNCVSSQLNGYLIGGHVSNSEDASQVIKIDFDTETSSTNPNTYSSPLINSKRDLGDGTKSASKFRGNNYNYGDNGYLIGGANPNAISNINRINLTTETWTTDVSPFPTRINFPADTLAASTSGFGYIMGGYAPLLSPTLAIKIARLEYHTETIRENSQSLPSGRYRGSKFHSTHYGYYSAGSVYSSGSIVATSSANKIDFHTESNTTIDPMPYNGSDFYNYAASHNSNYGFVHGPDVSSTQKLRKLDYSTETWSSGPDNVSKNVARKIIGPSNTYFFGGPSLGTDIKKFDLNDETTTAVSTATYPYSGTIAGGVFDKNYGYTIGGFQPGASPQFKDEVNKFDFAAETLSSTNSAPEAKYFCATAINSN